jgi:hypothetical protein
MITNRLTFSQVRAAAHGRRALDLWFPLCALVLGVSASAQEPTIITFDAPGAGTGLGQGTTGNAINPDGVITGTYVDAGNASHGFLRSREGAITTFDAPGAGTGAFQGTFACSVDCLTPEGAIAGDYIDANGAFHGLLRARDGTITAFDVPGAGTGSGQGTFTSGINPVGTITGESVDATGVNHGFLRARDGEVTMIDVPGAGSGNGQGTLPENINRKGAITGQYLDASGVNHGFLRAKHGAITTFDVPGAGTGGGQGTIAFCNNPADAITGYYIDASGANHGFLRTASRSEEEGE